jgi:hypothetical protein
MEYVCGRFHIICDIYQCDRDNKNKGVKGWVYGRDYFIFWIRLWGDR